MTKFTLSVTSATAAGVFDPFDGNDGGGGGSDDGSNVDLRHYHMHAFGAFVCLWSERPKRRLTTDCGQPVLVVSALFALSGAILTAADNWKSCTSISSE